MKGDILLEMGWIADGEDDRNFLRDTVCAHVGTIPPTREEMSKIMFAAKMEYARQIRGRKD